MNYLQSWIAERIAEKITIASLARPSETALHAKHRVVGEYITMRTIYGKKHHWPLDETGVDVDHYDHDPHSHYFFAIEKGAIGRRKLNAGMRLTRVDSFDDSLSLSMWAEAADKPSFVAQLIDKKDSISQLKHAARSGQLWDFTRLVTAMSLHDYAERTPKEKRATYVALLLMLGAAMRYTGKDAYWFFTTNYEVKRFLDRLGIEYSLLAKGRIGYSDTGESYFAWVKAGEAYELLSKQQSVVAETLKHGYDKGSVPLHGR